MGLKAYPSSLLECETQGLGEIIPVQDLETECRHNKMLFERASVLFFLRYWWLSNRKWCPPPLTYPLSECMYLESNGPEFNPILSQRSDKCTFCFFYEGRLNHQNLNLGVIKWKKVICFISISTQCKNVWMVPGTKTETRHELETKEVNRTSTGFTDWIPALVFLGWVLELLSMHRSGAALSDLLIPAWGRGNAPGCNGWGSPEQLQQQKYSYKGKGKSKRKALINSRWFLCWVAKEWVLFLISVSTQKLRPKSK